MAELEEPELEEEVGTVWDIWEDLALELREGEGEGESLVGVSFWRPGKVSGKSVAMLDRALSAWDADWVNEPSWL